MSRASLAERLGHSKDARLVIVNCDDLGLNQAVNTAIATVLSRGLASGATLMVPCDAAQHATTVTRGLGVGIHLTLNSEGTAGLRAVSGASSLTDADGVFLPQPADTWRSSSPRDVLTECTAQIERAMGWGMDPSHLDSHMGTVLLDERFALVIIRLARDIDVPLRMIGRPGTRRLLGLTVHGRRSESRRLADELGVIGPDHLVQCPIGARGKVSRVLRALQPGVTEVYLHPVVDDTEARGLADFDERLDDFRFLTETPTLASLLEEVGATMTSYDDLRALQHAER